MLLLLLLLSCYGEGGTICINQSYGSVDLALAGVAGHILNSRPRIELLSSLKVTSNTVKICCWRRKPTCTAFGCSLGRRVGWVGSMHARRAVKISERRLVVLGPVERSLEVGLLLVLGRYIV
jgi:hypothetical protein